MKQLGGAKKLKKEKCKKWGVCGRHLQLSLVPGYTTGACAAVLIVAIGFYVVNDFLACSFSSLILSTVGMTF